MDSVWDIRTYRPTDRSAVRRICAATCWMGQPRPDLIPDEWLWAEYWTRYFTDQEPEHTWVAEEPGTGRVGGYLTGTRDAHRVERYVPRVLPGMVWHVVRYRLMRHRPSRRAILAMVRSMLLDGPALPEAVARRYPATWHINLLPEARHGGVGGRLYARFLSAMRQRGARGIHAQVLDLNEVMQRFLARMGFAPAHSSPTSAFRHFTSQRVEIQTWVLDLSGEGGLCGNAMGPDLH